MKRKVIALLVICVMVLSGCGKTTPEEKSEETVQDIQQKEIADDFEELMEGTRELYERQQKTSCWTVWSFKSK